MTDGWIIYLFYESPSSTVLRGAELAAQLFFYNHYTIFETNGKQENKDSTVKKTFRAISYHIVNPKIFSFHKNICLRVPIFCVFGTLFVSYFLH